MEPIRCFEGTAQPYTPFWKTTNAADSQSGQPEMEFNGPISEYLMWGDEVTPKMFKDDLYRLGKNGPITIRVNSPGGDVFAGSVMRSILAAYPGHKTMIVTGMAASAAVAIVMAGDTVKIFDTAQMMIHEAAFQVFYARLDVPTLEQMTAELKVTNASLRDVYAAQTGIPAREIAKMMAATTWMSANDAVSMGFADEVLAGGKFRGSQQMFNALKKYPNVPAALLAMAQPTEEDPEPTPPATEEPQPEGGAEPEAQTPATEEAPNVPEGAPEAPALAQRRARLNQLKTKNQ